MLKLGSYNQNLQVSLVGNKHDECGNKKTVTDLMSTRLPKFLLFLSNITLSLSKRMKIWFSVTNILHHFVSKQSRLTRVMKMQMFNVNNFSVTLRYFILIATYVTLCISKRKRFNARLKTFFFLHLLEKLWWNCEFTSAFCFLHSLLYLIQKATISFYHMFLRPLNKIYFCVCSS